MTAPTTLSLDGIAHPACPTCGDTCLGPCQSCAERAETEYQTWQHISEPVERVMKKITEGRCGRRG